MRKLLSLQNIPHSRLNPTQIKIDHFSFDEGEIWGVIGGNGSGKTSFAAMLAGEIEVPLSCYETTLAKIVRISFEQEQKLLEREIREDQSEFLQKIDYGRSARELISECAAADAYLDQVAELLQPGDFLDRGFRQLSTGERRRTMIARALSQCPDLLILDEPFDGLDYEFTENLKSIIAKLSEALPLVVIANRLSDLGSYVTHLAFLHEMKLVFAGPREEIESSPLWDQFQRASQTDPVIPESPEGHKAYGPAPGEPIIEMRSVRVAYSNKTIIDGLDWQIYPSQHWKISGPNGCGKSTLVSLISGDHPQCYSNDLTLFGFQRGRGESIWEIKRYIGLMSTALHQDYRVRVTAEAVVLSGLFDTIGVYQPVSATQRAIACQWLEFLNLESQKRVSFQSLSFGLQRMLLIARALIKQPQLLILDEPCQGLDPINRALVLQLIDKIARMKIAQIIYISHETEDCLACLTHELRFVKKEGDIRASEFPFVVTQNMLSS